MHGLLMRCTVPAWASSTEPAHKVGQQAICDATASDIGVRSLLETHVR
jgi:hypothetical protein